MPNTCRSSADRWTRTGSQRWSAAYGSSLSCRPPEAKRRRGTTEIDAAPCDLDKIGSRSWQLVALRRLVCPVVKRPAQRLTAAFATRISSVLAAFSPPVGLATRESGAEGGTG